MTGPVVLRSVLVANRGEIARRVFRTARRLGLQTVAVHSDADADAAFVAEADLAVRLPGVTPAQTYLRGDLIIEAALRSGADCIHPGYGFLSENAGFARAVTAAGLVFVGPSAAAIEAMGSKPAAKALMAAAGVPVLPGVDAADLDGAELAAAGRHMGFPLLVKAAYGGGGRGMREVRAPAELPDAVAAARREAASAFGDGAVFLERLVEHGRHIEVQVFGDMSGTTVALFERECSIQRRHQKVVEEAPSPAVDADLRARLQSAAVAAARALDYVGAGTVEFLLAPDGQFFFLEVNTRLQVEHPVTEAVTGLDLVQLQLEVAAGRPLPEAAVRPTLSGAAIEVRLYAEDPARDFLPQAGCLDLFEVPHDEQFTSRRHGVRLDSGVGSGDLVGVHYDPMLAKVVSWGPDRTAAALALASALEKARLHGLVTNRDLLVHVLRSPAFLAGETDTGFLDGHPELFLPLLDAGARSLHLLAAALAGAALRRAQVRVLAELPTGWRNNPTQPQTTRFEEAEVAYGAGAHAVAGAAVDVEVLATRVDDVHGNAEGEVRVHLRHNGLELALTVTRRAGRCAVDGPLGSSEHVELPRFPLPTAGLAVGSLTAAMPGTVTRVAVAVGDRVDAGQELVVLEAMKMEHPVLAPVAGLVTAVLVRPGEQVETGAVLAVVEAGDDA